MHRGQWQKLVPAHQLEGCLPALSGSSPTTGGPPRQPSGRCSHGLPSAHAIVTHATPVLSKEKWMGCWPLRGQATAREPHVESVASQASQAGKPAQAYPTGSGLRWAGLKRETALCVISSWRQPTLHAHLRCQHQLRPRYPRLHVGEALTVHVKVHAAIRMQDEWAHRVWTSAAFTRQRRESSACSAYYTLCRSAPAAQLYCSITRPYRIVHLWCE